MQLFVEYLGNILLFCFTNVYFYSFHLTMYCTHSGKLYNVVYTMFFHSSKDAVPQMMIRFIKTIL